MGNMSNSVKVSYEQVQEHKDEESDQYEEDTAEQYSIGQNDKVDDQSEQKLGSKNEVVVVPVNEVESTVTSDLQSDKVSPVVTSNIMEDELSKMQPCDAENFVPYSTGVPPVEVTSLKIDCTDNVDNNIQGLTETTAFIEPVLNSKDNMKTCEKRGRRSEQSVSSHTLSATHTQSDKMTTLNTEPVVTQNSERRSRSKVMRVVSIDTLPTIPPITTTTTATTVKGCVKDKRKRPEKLDIEDRNQENKVSSSKTATVDTTTAPPPHKKVRLETTTREILHQKDNLQSADCVAVRDEALEYFTSLYDEKKGLFPMVRDLIDLGVSEDLMGMVATSEDEVIVTKVIAILCNIVLKSDTASKKLLCDRGVIATLCDAVKWDSMVINEFVCKGLGFLTTKTSTVEMIMCGLYAVLVKAFNGGDSSNETHYQIACLMNTHIGFRVPPLSLYPVVRMLIGLLQSEFKRTVIYACNTLLYILGSEEQKLILESLRGGIVATIAGVLSVVNLDSVVCDKVLSLLEFLSLTDETVSIREMTSTENTILTKMITQKVQHKNVQCALSGLRYICNVCASESGEVLENIFDSGVLHSLSNNPHYSLLVVKESVMTALHNFSLNATQDHVMTLMRANEGKMMNAICEVLTHGVKHHDGEHTEVVTMALCTVGNMVELSQDSEDGFNALINMLETGGAVDAIDKLRDVKHTGVREVARLVEIWGDDYAGTGGTGGTGKKK